MDIELDLGEDNCPQICFQCWLETLAPAKQNDPVFLEERWGEFYGSLEVVGLCFVHAQEILQFFAEDASNDTST